MATLEPKLRDHLATIIGKESRSDGARFVAETGAETALKALAVHRVSPYDHMDDDAKTLRNRLRARARQLGDRRYKDRTHEITRLVEQSAYEHWHRMLFARFLAENDLLIHPEYDAPVTLSECAELAPGAGAENEWELAGRFAARMLPQIFRPDDPVLEVKLAPEHQRKLEELLASIPTETFGASDALGWVYQFWQARRKKQINQSEVKVGADELPAVTQLFTEPYMVLFLLHNTLGAWWAGKILAKNPDLAKTANSEDELRSACAVPGYEWTSLRFVRGEDERWIPASGTFDGWPRTTAELKVMDPCCGSGHFLVEAFNILVRFRIAEEGISARAACDAVLRDNLFGLEIDLRCVQIAAFALAFAAWTNVGANGYRPLPQLNMACSGVAISARKEDWVKLAGTEQRLQRGMARLFDLFVDAPVLGSLIDPKGSPIDPLLTAGFEEVRPMLDEALSAELTHPNTEERELAIAARGISQAGRFLTESYHLVITNVPYLGRDKQDQRLRDHCSSRYAGADTDLAFSCMERFLRAGRSTDVAVVAPQHWLFLRMYRPFRQRIWKNRTVKLVAQLGASAFETIGGEVVNAGLFVVASTQAGKVHNLNSIDVEQAGHPRDKARALVKRPFVAVGQCKQLLNPDEVFMPDRRGSDSLLLQYADSFKGSSTGDLNRFVLSFWELAVVKTPRWVLYQGGASQSGLYEGRAQVLHWENGTGDMVSSPQCYIKGAKAWGRNGVSVNQMSLAVTVYSGEMFDENAAVIIPKDPADVTAIWCFCSSGQFRKHVRRIDKALKVTNKNLLKVPFDIRHWQSAAAAQYPAGFPEPSSSDPTQWLFKGGLDPSDDPLQVAVARLLGFRWPDQESDVLDSFVDEDGIVCVPAVRGERTASDRLTELLAKAYGKDWHPQRVSELLAAVGYEGKTLDRWLRDGFFDQHCKLFHNRPFIWHIWDGHREGFSALVNYHKLDYKGLESLTYTYLGDWIRQQEQAAKAGASGAGDRLAKAKTLQRHLELILEGESPHDIFVRWKPIEEQPLGWHPDMDDGVRLNIRPFMTVPDVGRKGAGILRNKPNVKWSKDRGKNPPGSPWGAERHNDTYLTRDQKRAAGELGQALKDGNRPGPDDLKRYRKRLGELLRGENPPPLFEKEVAEKLEALGLWEDWL